MLSFKAKILEIIDETQKVKLFRLEKTKEFSFQPGQFAMLSIEGLLSREGVIVKRSYSIASSPYDKYLEFCITKADNGFFSVAMHNLNAGDFVNVQAPYGVFTVKKPVPKNTVFVAGGSGIAPLMSIIRSLKNENAFPKGFRLFYGFRTPADFVYGKELQELAKKRAISLIAAIDKPAKGWNGETGFVSEVLSRHCDFEKSDAYLCGPPVMVTATIKELTTLGFDEKRIFREQW